MTDEYIRKDKIIMKALINADKWSDVFETEEYKKLNKKLNKDFYTQQKEDYSGIYTDSHNNVYDLCEYCGYWSLYMRIGNNGHTKTILDNSDLSDCLYEIATRSLVRLS